MATDYFLKLGQIQGESTAREHHLEIQVLSWQWGTAQDGGVMAPQQLTLSKYTDIASPLILAMHHRQLAEDAVLTAARYGRDSLVMPMRLTLAGARVCSYMVSGAAGDDRPIETIGLTFDALKMEVQPQDERGEPLDIVEYGFAVQADGVREMPPTAG